MAICSAFSRDICEKTSASVSRLRGRPVRALRGQVGSGIVGPGQPDVVMRSAAEVSARVPLAPGTARGGAMLAWDLQVNPRQAGAGLAAYLANRGVEFRYRTAVTAVRPGRVTTTRGLIDAGTVIVAVNHDIDQPEPGVYLVAATTGIGMTTGRGLAEHVSATVCDSPISLTLKGTP